MTPKLSVCFYSEYWPDCQIKADISLRLRSKIELENSDINLIDNLTKKSLL